MVVAVGSIAAIAAATWAAGVPTGGETPLSPADSPAQYGPSTPSSPGVVGPPLSDQTIQPGSPLSPGLPGNTSSVERSVRASADPTSGRRDDDGPGREATKHAKDPARGRALGKTQGTPSAKGTGAGRWSDRTSGPRSSWPAGWSPGTWTERGPGSWGSRDDDRGRGPSSGKKDDHGHRSGKHGDRHGRGHGSSHRGRSPHQH